MFKVFSISVVLSALMGFIVAKIAGSLVLGAGGLAILAGLGAVAVFTLYTIPAYRALTGAGSTTSSGGNNTKVS